MSDSREVPEWDSPLRRRNLEYGTNREIPDEEFCRGGWCDVTSMSDPPDARIWVYTGFGAKGGLTPRQRLG